MRLLQGGLRPGRVGAHRGQQVQRGAPSELACQAFLKSTYAIPQQQGLPPCADIRHDGVGGWQQGPGSPDQQFRRVGSLQGSAKGSSPNAERQGRQLPPIDTGFQGGLEPVNADERAQSVESRPRASHPQGTLHELLPAQWLCLQSARQCSARPPLGGRLCQCCVAAGIERKHLRPHCPRGAMARIRPPQWHCGAAVPPPPPPWKPIRCRPAPPRRPGGAATRRWLQRQPR